MLEHFGLDGNSQANLTAQTADLLIGGLLIKDYE